MIPRFFIDRPIFAAVLSEFITLAGSVAVSSLPVSQYPEVAPPTIQIDCNYPGASALVVSQSVAAPIEQQVNGVEDMLYMNSQCTSDGSYTCTITFKSGTDLNGSGTHAESREPRDAATADVGATGGQRESDLQNSCSRLASHRRPNRVIPAAATTRSI